MTRGHGSLGMLGRSTPAAVALIFANVLVGCTTDRCCGPTGVGTGTSTLYALPASAGDSPVGVFDRTAVLIAYYKSAPFTNRLRALKKDRDAARSAGDWAVAERLDTQGEAMQELAHRQLAGAAPLTNIADDLGEDLAEIARKSGVSSIVAGGTEPAGSRTIDLTTQLVERLHGKR